MSDGQGGGAIGDALANAGEQQSAGQERGAMQQQGQQDGQQGGGQQQQQEQRWQDKYLAEDLRGNEALANYKSMDDMAKAHIETQRWARGRIAVPAADADATAFGEFASEVRPEDKAAYKIVDKDGNTTEAGEQFRGVFHELGLHPIQAERLNGAFNQFAVDQASKQQQAGRDELTAIEVDLGPGAYNQRLTAVDNMLRGAGLDYADLLPVMEQSFGAGKAMKALFTSAEKTGELGKVDGAQVALRTGTMTAAQADAEVDRMDADPEMRAKVANKASPEYRRREELMTIVRRG